MTAQKAIIKRRLVIKIYHKDHLRKACQGEVLGVWANTR